MSINNRYYETAPNDNTVLDDEFDTQPVREVKQFEESNLVKYGKRIVIALIILLVAAVLVGMIVFMLKIRPRKPIGGTKLFVGKNGAVSSDIPECSKVGVSILKDKNGNAVDAAVATCFCIGVIGSYSSGIGGGAIIMIYDGTNVSAIDAREVASLATDKDMFNDLPTNASERGGLAIAVPGEVKGLYAAWKKYGSLPWSDLVQPAIQFAQNGYTIPRMVASRIKEFEQEILSEVYGPGMKEVYAPNGVILKTGDIAKNVKLAKTLQAIADHGEAAFYDTTVSQLARDIIDDIKTAGGLVNETDLLNYDVKFEEPLSTFYEGYKVFGPQPEISGGACVLFMLNILERYKLNQHLFGTFPAEYYLVEAMKFAFGHRMELGDPAFTQDLNSSRILDAMMSKDYAAFLRRYYLHPNHTVADFHNYLPHLDGTTVPLKASVPNHGTAHISVVDSKRMAVSMTTTINLIFGSLALGEKTGILFNDEMDDFSVPNRPNSFNLPPSEANFIAPGKRPLSSMSPTIVLADDMLKMAVGASGGPLITTSTIQVLLNVLDHGMLINEAIDSPRFHHQLLPPELNYEVAGFSQSLLDQMQAAGYKLLGKNYLGIAQGVVAMDDGNLYAASDRRKDGLADAY